MLDEDGPFIARVTAPAPAAPTDPLFVVIRSFDGGRSDHGPCLWEPPAGGLPQVGDVCVVVRALEEDGEGEQTIVIAFDRDDQPATAANLAAVAADLAAVAADLAAADSRLDVLEGAVPQARVYRSTSQSIPSGTTTAITFDQENYDTGAPSGQHSTLSNTARLTCVVAGLYLIDGAFLFDSTGGGDRSGLLRLNGTTELVQGGPVGFAYASAVNQRIVMSTHYRLVAGDYIEMLASQASGASRNVVANGIASPYLAFARLSA